MFKQVSFLVISILFVINSFCYAVDIWLGISTVPVTGTRFNQLRNNRQVSIISKEEIAESGADSVPELLKRCTNTDIQERSPYGMQSDITIRGSSFQQVLVLIDGVRVNDSQTAHHNMDLPVTLADIERIEVLNGPASSAYGPDALAGVVNIITKDTQKKELDAYFKASDFNTRVIGLSAGNKWGEFSQRMSFEKKKYGGFRYDTDFDNFNFNSKSSWQYSKGSAGIDFGYMEKEFGAFDFYTPAVSWEPKIFFRRHDDTYMLDITRPDFYLNMHQAYFYGAELQATIKKDLILGAELSENRTESVRMGNHAMPGRALFAEYRYWISSKADMKAGVRIDNSDWGSQVSPAICIANDISRFISLRGSVGKAFRSPSFTELYYSDPKNQGDSSLKPEEAVSYEAGADITPYGNTDIFCTFFDRGQVNLIAWAGLTPAGP